MAETSAFVNYYARTGYFRHLQSVCNDGLKRRSTDQTLVFWRAFGMFKEGSIHEAIRDLEGIASRGDMQLALPVNIALLHAHKASKVVDNEEVMRLEQEIDLQDGNAPDRARLLAAQLLWHLGDVSQAKDQVLRLLELQSHSVPSLALLGWLELADVEAGDEFGTGLNDDNFISAERSFSKALEASSSKKDLEALMGRARMHQLKGQYREALDHLSQAIVTNSWYWPALINKSHVHIAMGDWDQAIETADRVLSQEPQNIDAVQIHVLHLLSQEARYALASSRISELIDVLNRSEPQNAPLYYRIARNFSRLSGRNPEVLQHTLKLMERACKLANSTGSFAAELGYQHMLAGDIQAANASLKQASMLEAASEDVVVHQTRCMILLNELDDAEQQLEFLSATALTRTPEMALCSALISSQRGSSASAISLLDEALELHMPTVRDLAYCEDYFVKLKPDVILDIAHEYLKHFSTETEVDDSQSLAALYGPLDFLMRRVPGLLEGHMLVARARFVSGDYDAASRACSYCTKMDPAFMAASLLQAQIFSRQEKFSQANAVLEQALSHNFAVRESPLFALIKSKVLYTQGDVKEAAEVLEAAMKLPGVAPSSSVRGRGGKAANADLSDHDRCSIFLQLAEVKLELNERKEAKKLIQEAIIEFAGGSQEGRVMIASAQLQLKGGNVEKALQMLSSIPNDSAHYLMARKELASLYLNYRGDRHKYAQCHRDVVRANPTAASFVMLGEAYMHICEPQDAIAAFEKALAKSPGNSMLASRIGKVLVATHEYVKAIEYYSSAVQKDPSQTGLRHELAELYLQLKRYDQAESELGSLLSQLVAVERDLGEAMQQVKSMTLLAQVHKARGNREETLATLMKARAAQSNVLARMRAEAPDLLIEQRQITATICAEIAAHHESSHEVESAMDFYKEALRNDEGQERSSVALARIHLSRGETDAAESICTTLMRVDPGNNAASMMLADLMLQASDWDSACQHFTAQLDKKPADFRALARLLQVLRRAGRLQEAERYFTRAERSSSNAACQAGFHLCRGVLHRFQNNPRAALKDLNLARRDAEWGPVAIQNMIEIYLNPENETNWDEMALDQSSEPGQGVLASERLLRELPPSPRQQVLECYTLMCYKTRSHLEKAASMLLELLNTEREYVPAMVCLSQCYLMLKQAPKARNHLKRIAKMPFVAELADDFERGWLMLTDVYVVSGKYDLAEELCRRCLASNKSCAKAWEFLGVVKEKEMSYKDAASHYEKAWSYDSEASAAVGYKLSFNYLKAKKYVEAIDVCHVVLQQYPDYPKIRSDVLEKARHALRP